MVKINPYIMNKNLLTFNDTARELFWDKLETNYWSEVNKRYLLRLYHPLKNVMENLSKPKWVDVIREMGETSRGYYSCVYKALKEIGVIEYNPTDKILVEGPNWDRFFSDADWSWFYMNTNSGGVSYEIYNKVGNRINKKYQSNFRGGIVD